MSTAQIISHIAKKNDVTSKEVEDEILKAIDYIVKSKDPEVVENFKNIFNNNTNPSVDDIIKYCVIQVLLQTNPLT